MKKLTLAGLLSVVLVASSIIPAIAGNGKQHNGQEKVQICHWSEEHNKYIQITVAASAVEAHHNHGDVDSEIGMCNDGLDNDCDGLIDGADNSDCPEDIPEPQSEALACPYNDIEVCVFTIGSDSPCFLACLENVEDACSINVSDDCRNLIISISGCICQ